MNRPGGGGGGQQPIRGMSGFPNQQQPQGRPSNVPLSSQRLPPSKMGNTSNWGFGLPTDGAPGLQNNQQRNMNTMNSFAQSLGRSQPAAPLDLSVNIWLPFMPIFKNTTTAKMGLSQSSGKQPPSPSSGTTDTETTQESMENQEGLTIDINSESEFPSLSGGPQSQTPNPGQAIWTNANQRNAQQTLLQQRQPQAPIASQPPSRASQQQTQQAQAQSHASAHEDNLPTGTQFAAQLDDFRNGGSGISGQLAGGSQPKTGNIEDFPPLGKESSVEMSQDRRENFLQGGGFGNYGDGTAGSAINSSRSAIGQAQNGFIGQEKEELGSAPSMVTPQQQQQQSPSQLQPAGQQQAATANEEGQEAGTGPSQASEQIPLSQMSEQDRYGLNGLLRMIHSESPDVTGLTIGQDLMGLGLDLNQPEPLHQSFASPFVPSGASVPLQPEFTLPPCYTVANVPPLHSRIPSFSDETLFYIFYSMPRDIMQELVAEELMGRKWRYHKVERLWLTRDESYPNPVEVERGVSEHGVYLWWDTSTWKKARREFTLRYADLDSRLDPNRSFIRSMAFPQNT